MRTADTGGTYENTVCAVPSRKSEPKKMPSRTMVSGVGRALEVLGAAGERTGHRPEAGDEEEPDEEEDEEPARARR